MRMHHQKTGGNRNAGCNTVSVSVAVLLALVMLAAGVCGGFLLTREPEPAAFESTTRAGTLAVRSEPYDDERSVTVTVERSESGSVAAPVGGVVTELRQCASGSSIESGSAFIAVDGQPQLALYLRTPPYRTMTSGMKGGDIAALNAELRRLGYTAPDSDVMTWDTVKAFNALAAHAGTQSATQERQWSIDTSLFAWLPQQKVTVKECQARYGGHVEQGADVLTTTSQPVRATFRRNDSSMLRGDRVMEVNGATFTITDRTADSTDASLLSAIGASNEYRAAQQPSASGQASDTAGSQSDTGQDTASNTINVTYRWKLAKTLNVVSVPPAAMYDVSADSACVVSRGKPVAVHVVASQLGKSMVSVESGASLTSVNVPASTGKACRWACKTSSSPYDPRLQDWREPVRFRTIPVMSGLPMSSLTMSGTVSTGTTGCSDISP